MKWLPSAKWVAVKVELLSKFPTEDTVVEGQGSLQLDAANW